MKAFFTSSAICSAALLFISFAQGSAYADGIVFAGPDRVHPAGVGTVSTILRLQNHGTESGSVGRAPGTSGDVRTGDWTSGSNTQTRTLGELGVTQQTTALRINFNIIEPHGGPGSDPVTLEALTLTAYNASNAAVFSASLIDGPHTLAQIGSGQGTSDYVFSLDTAAAARLAAVYDVNLRIGLAATVSNADGGPETFFVNPGPAAEPIPEPATMLLLGTGLAGLASGARRRRTKK